MWNLDKYSIQDQMQFVDLLPKDNFDKLVSELDKIILEPTLSHENHVRISMTGQIPTNEEYLWIYDLIGNVAKEVNLKFFEYDLTHFHHLQYVTYSENDHCDEHVDYALEGGVWDFRKLSFSLLLNDDYAGGDLEIYGNEKFVADKKENSIVFYPSYLRHCITPVTAGVRRSLEGWICGPKFR